MTGTNSSRERKKVWNIANLLTMGRILVIPIMVLLMFFEGKLASFLAAFLFLVAALTDYVDGYLARRLNLSTNLGRFLDPMADKLLIAAASIMLIPLQRIDAWITLIILGRELLITGLRGIASTQGIVISASMLGKYKASFQMFALNLLILHYPYFGLNVRAIGLVLLYIALIITIWSGYDYFKNFLALLLEEEKESEEKS